MEAGRNLHMFHELPGKADLELADRPLLWAGADGRARHRLRAHVLIVLGQADARARIVSGAGNAVDLRDVGVGRGSGKSLRRIRHHERRAHRGELVLLLTGGACGKGGGMHWMRDDCDGRSDGDRERETAGKDQAAGCDRGSRHSQDSTTLGAVCRDSLSSLRNVSAAQTKSWGTLLRPSFVSASGLRARTDRGVGDGRWPLSLLLFGQSDALAGIGSGARNVVNLRQSAGRGLASHRRIRHQIGRAFTGEGVLGFTAGARRDRRRRADRSGEDRNGRGDRNSDRKSAGKDQWSCWKHHGRHRHAFSSC